MTIYFIIKNSILPLKLTSIGNCIHAKFFSGTNKKKIEK